MVLVASLPFANPISRQGNDDSGLDTEVVDNHLAPYYATSRQDSGVLFVEDPGSPLFGPLTKPDPVWKGVLDEIYGTDNYGWNTTAAYYEDGPDLTTMLQYELVIWNTYDYWWFDTAALTPNDQINISAYLDSGGMVWLIGQDILYSGVPLTWMSDYFHLDTANQDYDTLADSMHIHGLAEINSIGFTTIYDYQLNNFYPDELVPDAQAHAVLEDTDSSKVVGIFYPGTGDWMSAFWTVDGRPDTTGWNDWVDMVTGMIQAFGSPGISEMPSQEPTRNTHLDIVPDPLVRSTTIKYDIAVNGDVKVQVFNTAGQHVITLVDGYKHAGLYTANWNGKDARGVNVSNGVYFVRLTCGRFSCSANLVVVR